MITLTLSVKGSWEGRPEGGQEGRRGRGAKDPRVEKTHIVEARMKPKVKLSTTGSIFSFLGA